MLQLVRENGYKGILAGTRKTTPGFRIVEKYAMLVGGIDAHRIDLSSMIMLKDNHIWSKGAFLLRSELIIQGSITDAVRAARSVGGFALKIEVEVQSEAGADEAIAAGADIIMLDNFDGPGLQKAAFSIRERWNLDSISKDTNKVLLECSGGLTEENVASYLCNGISFLRRRPNLKPSTFTARALSIVKAPKIIYANNDRKCSACRLLSQN
jgi:nicotinate-nucleotide pyrophosphorylase (carboxylating)